MSTAEERMFGEDASVADVELADTDEDVEYSDEAAGNIMVSAAAAGIIMQTLANDRGLRRYWTKGAGAAKIRWGTDGSFDRCVRQLGQHVRNPQGLCAEYHKEATGEWPAEKGVESSVMTAATEEFHGTHNQADHNPHKQRGRGSTKTPSAGGGSTKKGETPAKRGGSKEAQNFVDRARNMLRGTGSTEEKRRRAESRMSNADLEELGDIADALGVRSQLDSTSRRGLIKEIAGHMIRLYAEDDEDKDTADWGDYALTAAKKSKDAEWSGVLTVEGAESGDGRLFHLGSLDWATLPLPLMYQPANVGGHSGSFQVGDITHIARKGNEIFGWGTVFSESLDGEHGAGIRRMIGTNGKPSSAGVSVDVDKVKDADVEFVYNDDSGHAVKPEMTIFHRGRIRGATLVAFPAFVEAKLAFTGDNLTASVDDGCGCGEGVLTAGAYTFTIPDLPKKEWFDRPTDVKMHGALTVTQEGRVFGRLARKGVTHRSVNRQVPLNTVDYSRWMNKETIVEGGERVVTGVITMNCGHAPTEHYGTLANRKQHYDNSCSIVANVRIGEDADGVWVAGALRHGVTSEQVATMMGCQLSGDWQPHPDRRGTQEFIAALLVPVPGFPEARTRASVAMEDGVIVAATVPVQFTDKPDYVDATALNALATAKRMLATSMGIDPHQRRKMAAASLGLDT